MRLPAASLQALLVSIAGLFTWRGLSGQCHLNKVLALWQGLNYVAVVDTQLEDIFGLYERCLVGVIEYLQAQVKLKVRRSVYTAQVVIWLMIVQRLQPHGTLSGGVDALLSGAADRLLSGCERARQKRILRNTGGDRPRAR